MCPRFGLAQCGRDRIGGSLRVNVVAGLLLGVNSLGSEARRLAKRDGSAQVWDGPFAESKEMVGGYFLLDTDDPAVALAWAERCPAAEWATVEIRGVGPCYL